MFPKFKGIVVESTHGNWSVSGRCPGCRHMQTFLPMATDHACSTQSSGRIVVGSRICSNPNCRMHVFFVGAPSIAGGQFLYPPETIDFDTTGLPVPIVAAFEEAILCHASGCYVACAIMVRKTLEELCADKKATGSNLAARIKDLGSKIVIPKELLDGIDHLRLLGNDAAHIESQAFNQVGKPEVEVAIELTKELLKATYQLSSLLAKMQALRKTP
jgi:hypothetical protein